MIKKSISALILLFGASNLMADISIEHDKLEYIVSGHRIALKANIKEGDSPIDVVRTYFKSSDGKNFVFVDMKCKKEACSSILPSIKKETKAIDYLFLVKDESGKVIKTQTFRVEQKDKDVPKWQQLKSDDKILVKTELLTPPETLEGFDDDNIAIDIISLAAKYGVSAGISGTGGTASATTGTTMAKMSASGISNGGTTVATGTTTVATGATATGVSTTAIVVGSVATAGVAVAVGSGGSGGSGGGDDSITDKSTIDALKGKWSAKDVKRTTKEWSMTTNIGDSGSCTYTECAYGSCTDGICSVTLSTGIFTFKSDGGANFSADIIGAKKKFSTSGKFANGTSGKIDWTKK